MDLLDMRDFWVILDLSMRLICLILWMELIVFVSSV